MPIAQPYKYLNICRKPDYPENASNDAGEGISVSDAIAFPKGRTEVSVLANEGFTLCCNPCVTRAQESFIIFEVPIGRLSAVGEPHTPLQGTGTKNPNTFRLFETLSLEGDS